MAAIQNKNIMQPAQKRLAIFLPNLYGGGAERVTLNLAAGFAATGYNVDLVLVQAEGPYMAEIPGNVRVVELNGQHRQIFRTVSSLPALVRYLRRQQPDAMLSSLNYANVIALWAQRLAGFPGRLVISEHNTFSNWKQVLPGWYRWLILRLMSSFYPWAFTITTVSEGVANDLAREIGIHRDRIRVIYNPIVTPELALKANAELEHPWFREGQPPVILGTGRLTTQKGFDVLIKAFAEVRRRRPARLLILGEGEDRPALEGLVSELGLEQDVCLPGFVANPYAYMARAAVFVLSSRWEGLPTVLVEALFCGAPLVSTDCPSGPHEILRGGQYGQLVPVEDETQLARAILKVLDSDRLPPSPEGWKAFDLATVVSQYVDVLFGP